jgi:hypothetical protein
MKVNECVGVKRREEPPAFPSKGVRNDCPQSAFQSRLQMGVPKVSKTPPIPEQNRDPGMGGHTPSQPKDSRTPKAPPRENLKEQGRQGNINQNTHNQGYQQNR